LEPGKDPVPLTLKGNIALQTLFMILSAKGSSVRDDHTQSDSEAVNTIVAIDLTPGVQHPGTILVQGNDFYAYPRLSPDGALLAGRPGTT
jgi:hypothetical protein